MLNLIKTADGSNSLLNSELDETYHSRHGAIQESLHVFIKNGVHYWLDKNQIKEISILEVGFGTGLNALLALQESIKQKIKIHYVTTEAFPVPIELVDQLNYSQQLDFESADKYFKDLHQCEWNTPVTITPNFFLEKCKGKIQEMELGKSVYDVVFFDAFAPAKQPEMWELTVLEKTVRSLKSNGIFVTYCAQGQLKRNLKFLGMKVESLPGPPGKREMVRAIVYTA
jgi:tRNA U34 5-methylaminomethyl-2-thiouridine-forming methyltransferase MnmC